jgi:hypothetical protein
MARNYLGDIPGNFFMTRMGANASVASNGAAARLGDVTFIAPADLKVLSAWRAVGTLLEASISKAVSTYRDIFVMNGGLTGTVATVTVASVRSGTKVGPVAGGSQALTTVAAGASYVSAGEILYGSLGASIGAASDDTTAVSDSVWFVAYELL